MKQILVNVKKCLGCKSCELACSIYHSEQKDLYSAVAEKPRPSKCISVEAGSEFNLPLQCRHCEEPKCVDACISGALTKETNGTVLHNIDRCIGCWMCAMVCPFGSINRDLKSGLAVKCDRCQKQENPQCVNACPTKALEYTTIDKFSKDNRKNYLTNYIFS